MRKLNKLCESFHKMDLAGQNCPKCHYFKCGRTYEEKLKEKVDAVPQEKKQKLLDLVWSGLTLGEAAEKAGFEKDTGVYAKILQDNIGQYHYLRKEAI